MTTQDKRTRESSIDIGIDGFWETIANANPIALLLDYDGTLAPFHVDRLKAFPSEGVPDALRTITVESSTIVALVSGRPVEELLSLITDLGVTIIGTHGFEIRRPGQDIEISAISDVQTQQLDRALADAHRLIGRARTERKVATVAAHFRGLDRLDARQLHQDLLETWLSYADTSAVEVRQFNGGLEMRALGRHKGTAVGQFLDTCPAGTLAVYVGDDDTDEDAFRTVNELGGYGIRVGGMSEATSAGGSLPSCEDVPEFLRTWIEVRR